MGANPFVPHISGGTDGAQSSDALEQPFLEGPPLRVQEDLDLKKQLSEMFGYDRRRTGIGQAGDTSLQRNAIFNSLLSGANERRVFLESVRGLPDSGSETVGGETRGTFYSRNGTAMNKQPSPANPSLPRLPPRSTAERQEWAEKFMAHAMAMQAKQVSAKRKNDTGGSASQN